MFGSDFLAEDPDKITMRFKLSPSKTGEKVLKYNEAMDPQGIISTSRLVAYLPDFYNGKDSIDEKELLFGDRDFYLNPNEDTDSPFVPQSVRLGNIFITFQQNSQNVFFGNVYIVNYKDKKHTQLFHFDVANLCALTGLLPVHNPYCLKLKGELKLDPYIQRAAMDIRVALVTAAGSSDYLNDVLVPAFRDLPIIKSRRDLGLASMILRGELAISRQKIAPVVAKSAEDIFTASLNSVVSFFQGYTTVKAPETAAVFAKNADAVISIDVKNTLQSKLLACIDAIQNPQVKAKDVEAEREVNSSKLDIVLTDMINCLSFESLREVILEAQKSVSSFSEFNEYLATKLKDSLVVAEMFNSKPTAKCMAGAGASH